MLGQIINSFIFLLTTPPPIKFIVKLFRGESCQQEFEMRRRPRWT